MVFFTVMLVCICSVVCVFVLCVVKVGSWLAGMMAFTLTLTHDGNIGM